MNMKEEWLANLRQWASQNDAIRELWLFGSRAKNTAGPESDVEVGLVLMPPRGCHDWALGAFAALQGHWHTDLQSIVDNKVSMCVLYPDAPLDMEVRRTGYMLFSR